MSTQETQVTKDNKPIMMGVLIITLIYVIIMNQILGNELFSNSQNSGLTEITLTKQEAVAECSFIIATDEELEIASQIAKLDKVQEHYSQISQQEDEVYIQAIDITEDAMEIMQEFYDQDYLDTYNPRIVSYADLFNISFADEETEVSFVLQYNLDGNFNKLVFTLNNPDAPYYLNDNNTEFTKITF